MINLIGKIYKGVYRRFKGYLQHLVIYLFDKSSLKVFWWDESHNFGDALNPLLINMLSGKKVSIIDPIFYRHENYLVIGSILAAANKYSVIWGAGFIREESKCKEKPLKVCAVRGPLTRQKLLNSGINCPEVYGDPALLLPLIYAPKIKKQFKLGIIPHIHDKSAEWLQKVKKVNIKVIDIQNPDPMKFIDELLSCEQIASSSLHGLIVADAYKIPSIWLEFSDKVEGKGFKFRDYFLSVNRSDTKPLVVNHQTTLNDILNKFVSYEINIDLLKLLDSCPFELSNNFKDSLGIV